MTSFAFLKLIHVIGATLLLGTGLGIAFFLFMANRSRNVAAIHVTARHVVLADWVFTMPAVIAQPITGYLLMRELNYGFDTAWFAGVVGLYLLAGACWIPVVFIQRRIRDLAGNNHGFDELPEDYHRLIRTWTWLGVPAFTAVVMLYGLMIIKPGM